MSQKPKLYYFNTRGRAEIIRLVFTATGTDFEDIRYSWEEWPQHKHETPNGTMPYVDTGDKSQGLLAQSGAIARYYAKKAGLMGANDWEYYQVERAMFQVDDMFQQLIKIIVTPADKKADVIKEVQGEKGQALLRPLVQFLKDNGGQFYAGKSLSLADLASVTLVDNMTAPVPELLAKFPELTEHRQRIVASNAKLAEHMKNRPETPM